MNDYAVPVPPCEKSVTDYKKCVNDNDNCGSNITNTYHLKAIPKRDPQGRTDPVLNLTFCGTCKDLECTPDWKKEQGKGTLYEEIDCDSCLEVNLDEKSWKPPCPPTCPPGCKLA